MAALPLAAQGPNATPTQVMKEIDMPASRRRYVSGAMDLEPAASPDFPPRPD